MATTPRRASGRKSAAEPPAEPVAAPAVMPPPAPETEPRFQFFVIDSGWKSEAARVLRDNFPMLREFLNHDPLYVLTRQQSVELIRKNPALIGKDPVLLVHDLQARGGRGLSGYHGFRLNLGLVKRGPEALDVLQQFLSFIANHRLSADIEADIRQKLHKDGLEGAIEVIREGAKEVATT